MIFSSIIKARPGELIGISNWRTLSQTRIDQFASATEDSQFIHVDPVRARNETPFGGTIAHGFLTLSMMSTIASEVIPNPSLFDSIIIVAIDRVKFIVPVRSGQRIRGIITLERLHSLAKDRAVLKAGVVIEIDGEKKPAVTCNISWIATLSDVAMLANERADKQLTIDASLPAVHQSIRSLSFYDLHKT